MYVVFAIASLSAGMVWCYWWMMMVATEATEDGEMTTSAKLGLGVGLLGAIIGTALFVFLLVSVVHAHDLEHPERTAWMVTLDNVAGTRCCEVNDHNAIVDVPWATYSDIDGLVHYKVMIAGDWLKVDDDKVVREPNPYRVPVVWYHHNNGVFMIRCFLPGAGL